MINKYQELDVALFDYGVYAIEGITNRLFRGPAVDRRHPYIACIGAAQTFGRFCSRPFPALLADRLGVQVLNLGAGGAGPKMFNSPNHLELLNSAEFVVVQVFSGRSESNSYFDNSKGGGRRGVRLKDGKVLTFEEFLREFTVSEPTKLVKQVINETRYNYVNNMIRLLNGIRRPKVLFWFSRRLPKYDPDFTTVSGVLRGFPQLVDDEMLNEIRPWCDMYIECVSSKGLPQKLWPSQHEIPGTSLNMGMLFNRYYPSPEMHAEAADLLAIACRRLLSK